jgi:hypothetical protein
MQRPSVSVRRKRERYSHSMPADTRAAAQVWNDAMVDVIQEQA